MAPLFLKTYNNINNIDTYYIKIHENFTKFLKIALDELFMQILNLKHTK